ncbi:MAG: HupE/UreJ family protein [Gemmatimonadaceae bacterium]|nr:HupE/UreJ family protein [Gemmatimonadaceae bacterium]
MSELLTYIDLGFRHITDPNGADHILFLLALAAIYGVRDWRRVVWVVTAFTIGHSLTLALAVTGWLRLPASLIEFLIPVTIVLTAVENVFVREGAGRGLRYRPVLAGVFGLVHGAGFANYLRSLFVERLAVPLFGFNVGIELGQLLVLGLAFAAFALVDRALAAERGIVPRLRTLAVSGVVAVVALRWAVERAPW